MQPRRSGRVTKPPRPPSPPPPPKGRKIPPKGRKIPIKKDENRREINAFNALVYPNDSQENNTSGLNLSQIFRKSYIRNFILPENPGPGNATLVWYFFDDDNGRPWSPEDGTTPTILGKDVDLVANSFVLDDTKDTTLFQNNPYTYVLVQRNKELRREALGNDRYSTIKMDVVAVYNPFNGNKEMVRFKGNDPLRFYTKRKTGENYTDHYGLFAAYTPTPPPSPTRFGKKKKASPKLRSVMNDIRYLRQL